MNQTTSYAAAAGNWGGDGVNVVVGSKSVKFIYGCAQGEIRQQLRVDGKGNFRVNGFHQQNTPGPTYENGPSFLPARYDGKITGKVMKYKVTLTDTNDVIGEFTVEHGKGSSIKRCH